MRIIINKLNTRRNNSLNRNIYELILKFKYAVRNLLGYFRGFLVSLTGKIRYEDGYRPLIIGAWSQLLIRPGSSIVLKNQKEEQQNDVFNNNSVFITASTIGTRPHYLALDPPALNPTRIELLDNAELILEQNTIILSGSYISGSNNAQIMIGRNSYISQEVIMNSRNSIKIGRNVLIGHNVLIMDYDAHTVLYDNLSTKQLQNCIDRKEEIVIHDNVWIGARVTILKGVTIGAGSIVGANSCVVCDIPPNALAVGNPAKIVKENISWQR